MPNQKKCLIQNPLDNKVSNLTQKVAIPGALYKSGNNWFFKISVDGERLNIATHTADRDEAEKFKEKYLASLKKEKPNKVVTLFKKFSVPEQNPKYLEAQTTGENYTLRYARMEASRVQHLLELTPSDILDKRVKDLDRDDCERVREVIFKKYGTRPVAGDTFKTFKAILNWAYSKGMMKNMIAFRMKGIKTEKKERKVPSFNALLQTAKNPLCFRTELDMDRFSILLGTGLRRAELSAIQGRQLKRARIGEEIIYVLDISQSWKDEAQHELGKPKWNIQRIIPLAKEIGERLWKYKKGDEDFLMKTSNSVWTDSFAYTQGFSGLEVTPHTLRHALNTKLIEDGANPILVQEYFGWHHQDRNKIQEGYTHLYITALLEISKRIENIFENPESSAGIEWLD